MAGLPNGAYHTKSFQDRRWRNIGRIETPDAVTVALEKVQLTAISVSSNPNVTARGIYRPANGTAAKKLVAYLSDNLTTSYLDNIADVALGNAIPTQLTSINGLEQFPSDFHDTIFVRGLWTAPVGSGMYGHCSRSVERKVKRMWADQKQGQNVMQVMPKYGQGLGGGRSWRERIPT